MGQDFYFNPPHDDDPTDTPCPFRDDCCPECKEIGMNIVLSEEDNDEVCCEH
jgi:hypothetical protein